MRRTSDRQAVRHSVFGVIVTGLGVYLHSHDGFSEWGTIALILIGGVLFQGHSLVGLVAAWRRNGDASIRQRRESGAEDGVEPT